MKISEKLINEMQHIKVNKKQDSINDSSYPIIRGKKLYPSQYQTRNSPNDLIFTEMKNNNNSNNNYYFFQNGINNNYLTVENYPLDTDPKDIKYHRINNKRFNKNENKMNYSSITNNKYKKKFVDDEKGKKLYIYKSETQYPLRKKKESIGENDNKSMKIINYNIDKKTMNLKQFNIANKYNSNEDFEECTFKPKFESDPKACEKLFKNKRKKNKDISEYRGNAEFFLRYTKARDEYLIKRFRKMYRKDDSYDNSLISLTKRLCNKHYRNYLNVNNKIPLFGETISPDSQIYSSIVDFRGLSFQNDIPEQKNAKNKNDYIIGLRRNLHSLDLNEE